MMEFLFWLLLIILFYSYAGYGMILWVLVRFKRILKPRKPYETPAVFEPEVTLFVTAFNEKDYIARKVDNSFSLDYPKEKVQYIWVTDGSDDGTPELLKQYPGLEVYHQPERRGKIDAMNRGMQFVRAPFVIFSDANTRLSKNTIRVMMKSFADPAIGCVAGEKRIVEKEAESASAAGEGLYWRIESRIKKMDAELNSAVGGVGELFAIRTELFQPVEKDTILDDFIISLRIASRGYRIDYTPDAWAEETASLNVKEELKRKVRIAAGGVQTMLRLGYLLNPFRYGLLSWQYFSHKVLRWSVAPVFLFLFLPVNIALVASRGAWTTLQFPTLVLWFQLFCYALAMAGWFLEHRRLRLKIFFAPYYFVAINYASIKGIIRYFKGQQKVTWEKSRRAS
ncbi:MAG: glycosyltransferase family 2 protein [Bacteroidota bacterium]|jgi:cellulose synthase/poly-beta-1,6-N-acetylglucosamine synthase-like glycosyltransferase|nr:glycosyltransferase family 2 protein [Prolixibacteraceae bacterium]MDI9564689.1 glycosyltransferase family 2 protein [Bacteroidota bacterium]NLS98713.1 glycosyltransferase family 2 protein [Bacteroidales bacterium]OQB81961.1 MAG: Poly-beta-1,6-N-acetyl-D-glucosamine synthase [Bacteroidetes bacterium ADurb.Bin123]HNZ69550.1 glycosyltransferase family 2 protein [Prolixibacteraceae bacterium]